MSFLASLERHGGALASAATLSIPIEREAFDVTGTTGITTINTNGRGLGAPIRLRFLAACTLTHQAMNLNIPGAANYTTAVGDVLLFEVIGENQVRCLVLFAGGALQQTTSLAVPYTPAVNDVGNVTTGGSVIENSEWVAYSSGGSGAAFDGNPSTHAATYNDGQWLGYSKSAPFVANRLIAAFNSGGADPSGATWKIEASLLGDWSDTVVLDTHSNVSFDTGGSGSSANNANFDFTNSTAYRAYRLKVYNRAPSGNCWIFNFQLVLTANLPSVAGSNGTVTQFGALNLHSIQNASAATVLGAVVRKMEIFDGAGGSLGFVPVYDTIS